MAAEAETRRGELAGRLRLVPAPPGPGDARSALTPGTSAQSASAVVRFALAPLAQAGGAAESDTPTNDAGAPHLAAVLRAIGAMPGLRFLRADEMGRADVVVFTDASLPALALAPSYPSAMVVLTEHGATALTYLRARHEVGWAVLPPTSAPLTLAAAITAAAQGLTVLTASHADLLLSPEPVAERHGVNGAIGLYDAHDMHDAHDAHDAHDMHDAATLSLHATPPTPTLTARERETLELLSEGLSNKLIARRLRISEHTVKFHISALYAKLGASSRADAVSRAARRGVLMLTALKDAPTA